MKRKVNVNRCEWLCSLRIKNKKAKCLADDPITPPNAFQKQLLLLPAS